MERRSFLAAVGSVAFGSTAVAQQDEVSPDSRDSSSADPIRVVAWNVACGQWCTPKQVVSALEDRKPDLVLTNETPKFNRGVAAPDWSQEIADGLGLEYFYVGSISSGNHRAPDWDDISGRYGGKFKSILSRWPISNTHDYELAGVGWSPASAIRVQAEIDGSNWAIYSLHVPGHNEWEPSKHRALAEDIIKHEPLDNVIVGGDFNVRTDSKVLGNLQQTCGLKNTISESSIDHILYKSKRSVRVVESGIDGGPAGKGPQGGLSDHPYAWAELIVGG